MLRRNEVVNAVKEILLWKTQAESYQGNHVSDEELAKKIVETVFRLTRVYMHPKLK